MAHHVSSTEPSPEDQEEAPEATSVWTSQELLVGLAEDTGGGPDGGPLEVFDSEVVGRVALSLADVWTRHRLPLEDTQVRRELLEEWVACLRLCSYKYRSRLESCTAAGAASLREGRAAELQEALWKDDAPLIVEVTCWTSTVCGGHEPQHIARKTVTLPKQVFVAPQDSAWYGLSFLRGQSLCAGHTLTQLRVAMYGKWAAILDASDLRRYVAYTHTHACVAVLHADVVPVSQAGGGAHNDALKAGRGLVPAAHVTPYGQAAASTSTHGAAAAAAVAPPAKKRRQAPASEARADAGLGAVYSTADGSGGRAKPVDAFVDGGGGGNKFSAGTAAKKGARGNARQEAAEAVDTDLEERQQREYELAGIAGWDEEDDGEVVESTYTDVELTAADDDREDASIVVQAPQDPAALALGFMQSTAPDGTGRFVTQIPPGTEPGKKFSAIFRMHRCRVALSFSPRPELFVSTEGSANWAEVTAVYTRAPYSKKLVPYASVTAQQQAALAAAGGLRGASSASIPCWQLKDLCLRLRQGPSTTSKRQYPTLLELEASTGTFVYPVPPSRV
eukprot:Rhum_TRINITY_DN9569_c0_g1::Rhum_TRINITY_DN9569_c0_g1_i1::g.34109::m.34109